MRDQVDEHVRPAVQAPVAHAHGVAVAHLDEPELLEALHALADRGHVDAELGGQRALRRQPLAGGVAAGERRRRRAGGRPGRGARCGRGRRPSSASALFQCSEQFKRHGCRRCRPTRSLPCLSSVPFGGEESDTTMPLCFIEPQDAIRVIVESVGREARRQLLGELVRAWVDEIPEAGARLPLREGPRRTSTSTTSRCSRPGTPRWRSAHPIANRDFLVDAFSSLGETRREALKIAAGMRGEEAFNAGVAEEQALETVPAVALRGALRGARRRVPRALLLGPAGLRELMRRRRRRGWWLPWRARLV